MIVSLGNIEYKNKIHNPIFLKDLVSKYPIITQKEPSNTRSFLNSIMKSHNIEFHPQFDIVSYSLVKDFGKIGMGISYITKEFSKSELLNNELFPLETVEKIPTRHLGIVSVKSNINTLATQKFIELILNK